MAKVTVDIPDKNLYPEIKKEIQRLNKHIKSLETTNSKLKAQLAASQEKIKNAETIISIAENIVEYCHECEWGS